MDARILEAFIRLWHEILTEPEFPIEPSQIQSLLNQYQGIDYRLSFKESSYKKIGAFLESLDKQGLIRYKTKGDHKVVEAIDKKHEIYQNFAPSFSLRRVKPKIEESKNECDYPRVSVEEVYQLGGNLKKISGKQ